VVSIAPTYLGSSVKVAVHSNHVVSKGDALFVARRPATRSPLLRLWQRSRATSSLAEAGREAHRNDSPRRVVSSEVREQSLTLVARGPPRSFIAVWRQKKKRGREEKKKRETKKRKEEKKREKKKTLAAAAANLQRTLVVPRQWDRPTCRLTRQLSLTRSAGARSVDSDSLSVDGYFEGPSAAPS